MNEEAFLKRRAEGWERLNQLTIRAESSVRGLSGEEIVEFVRLYRQASSDLADLMTHSSNRDVVAYLNELVGKAYGQLYRHPRRPMAEAVPAALLTVAETVRRRSRPILLAAAIFFAAWVCSSALLSARPDLRRFVVPSGAEENFAQWREGTHEGREGHEQVAMTAFYASNNPVVGIMTLSVSVATFGLGSAFILWQNGLLVGALASDMAGVGKLGFLLSSIAPHGVSEIGGFFVAGGAGFAMAGALIRPGRRSRGAALREAGKDALILGALALVMILLAAPIEGFFSFNPAVPQAVKAVFAALAFAAWMSFFVGYGRGVVAGPGRNAVADR